MQLSSILKSGRSWWKQISTDSVSPEYKQWRHRFILKRLLSITWILIIVFLLNNAIYWTFGLSLQEGSQDYETFRQDIRLTLVIEIIIGLQFLLTFILFKVTSVRQNPLLIYLWLSWSAFLSPSIIEAIFLRRADFEVVLWMIYFSGVAIFLPVQWRWHLFSQGIILGLFAFCFLVLGLRDPQIVEREIYFYFIYTYLTLVVCLIASIGVFLYERLIQQEFELRRQLRLFVYAVSHDLRNPMLGTIWLLKSFGNSATGKIEMSREILDRMIDSSDRQLQLIDSLLEAHNTETKGIIIRPRPVSLDNLVQSVITDMQPFFDKEQATVTQKTSATLPLVNIDPLQVRRVYENLIANALEYNQSGLHLTLEVKDDPSLNRDRQQKVTHRWIYCIVSDNGIGISPGQSSQIFDLYTRAASNKQSLNVGLGLYICRQIINAHGGEIGVNSTQKGASFWFTLPIAIDINRLSQSKLVG